MSLQGFISLEGKPIAMEGKRVEGNSIWVFQYLGSILHETQDLSAPASSLVGKTMIFPIELRFRVNEENFSFQSDLKKLHFRWGE